MSESIPCTYTPPPPSSSRPVGKSSSSTLSNTTSASSTSTASTIKPFGLPSASSPLPTHSTLKDGQVQGTALTSAKGAPVPAPQIRYCYFISAASASTSQSRNPSLSRRPVYLNPHPQPLLAADSIDATSPNGPQPRTRSSAKDSSSPGIFILGPKPPQIQLGFLEDEPLPPTSTLEPPSDTLADTDPSSPSDTSLRKLNSTDVVLVERKDSGYGGSVSRSSSLAAFGRGIRKVFWRNSAKGSVESVVISEAPILDCDIPQDVLDHEGWAQDLAQRLSLASGPDAVSTWLGQLPSESTMTAELFTAFDGSVPIQLHADADADIDADVDMDARTQALTTAMGHSASSLSVHDLVEEELVFNIPLPPFHPIVVPPSPPPPPPPPKQEADLTAATLAAPAKDDSQDVYHQSESPVVKTLRSCYSMEMLNKPQPPLPKLTLSVPQPHIASKKQNQQAGSSSLNSLSSMARKLTIADFGFMKNTGRNSTLPQQQQQQQRPRVQDLFQEPTKTTLHPGQRRHSSHSAESLLDERFVQSRQLMMSPEELDAPSYLQVKPEKRQRRSTGFFKNLGSFSTEPKVVQRTNEEPPPSEVLLSNCNLSPEEITKEIALASRSTSLRSPVMRKRIPVWEQAPTQDRTTGVHSSNSSSHSSINLNLNISNAHDNTFLDSVLLNSTDNQLRKRHSTGLLDVALAPPEPLFYNKGVASSTSSLGEGSTCGSMDSFAVDSSADEWEGLGRLGRQNKEQNSRYSSDLKELQSMLYSAQAGSSSTTRPHSIGNQSTNTSTGSLTLTTPPNAPMSTSPSNSRRDSRALFKSGKKEDYMSHRLSGLSPKLQPKLQLPGKTKPRSKSRLSMTYGGGELEVVSQAKFDTPAAIARNKEIRKFISQEIYTTEQNYLQYLRTIQEVFVEPLERSMETEKPFIPRSNALFQLLAHVSELIHVSNMIVQALGDRVCDEVWSDDDSLVGMVFLDVKEPLSIFLMYGQSYVKGMKALRSLLKSKRASTSVYIPSTTSTTNNTNTMATPGLLVSGGPRMDKRRSLPSAFSLNMTPNMSSAAASPLDSKGSNSSSNSNSSSSTEATTREDKRKSRSSHGMTMPMLREATEYEKFIRSCIGGKETTSRFSLADLLILPIQRVTRYCLLLKDLKRHTDVDHADYVGLVHALEQLHTLAMATNDVQPSSLRS
ncbi:Rho guanine nucleotide exchange factor (GEF) 17 [Podila humilis]|nr:Rho guanine nucleotide exchange factor (GEF) 17 [Podila humilis]